MLVLVPRLVHVEVEVVVEGVVAVDDVEVVVPVVGDVVMVGVDGRCRWQQAAWSSLGSEATSSVSFLSSMGSGFLASSS